MEIASVCFYPLKRFFPASRKRFFLHCFVYEFFKDLEPDLDHSDCLNKFISLEYNEINTSVAPGENL